jgi:hypothetical protein
MSTVPRRPDRIPLSARWNRDEKSGRLQMSWRLRLT